MTGKTERWSGLWSGLGWHVWIFWALAAAPLLELLRGYPEFFIAHDMGGGQLAALISLLLLVLPLPWVVAAHWLRRRRQAPLLLLPPWLLLTLALTLGAGFAALALPTALAASALAWWAYARSSRIRRYCSWLGAVALVAPLAFLADDGMRKLWLPMPDLAATATGAPDASGDAGAARAPVVLLILDELPASALLDDNGTLDARRFPNLAALAENAHWFDNVLSVDSSTPKAVSALLAGTVLGPDRLPLARDLPTNLCSLLAPTHHIVAWEPVTGLCPPPTNSFGRGVDESEAWLTDTAVVGLHLVTPPPWAARLPPIADRWGGFGTAPSGDRSEADEEPTWKDLFARAGKATQRDRVAGFERFVATIRPRRHGALYVAHLLLPHRPWAHLPSGATYWPARYREPKVFHHKEWPASPAYAAQAYQRHLLQAQFVDRLVGTLTERLRRLGLYDESLIVITADHGISFLPGKPKRAVTPATESDILQVPLLLKLPGQIQSVLHREPRSTLDVLPTILEVLAFDGPETLAGRSLLGPPPAPSLGPTLGPSLGPSRGPSRESSEWQADEAPWLLALERRHELFGPLTDDQALYSFGPHQDWLGRRLDTLELRQDERLEIELGGPGWEFEHSVDASVLPAWVYGRLRGPAADRPLPLGIAVDGAIVAIGVQDPKDESGGFRVLLPEHALPPGRHLLEIVVLDIATGRGRLPSRS